MLMAQEINRTNLTSPFKCDHKVQVNRNQNKAQKSSDDNVKDHNLIILHCMMKRLMWTDSTTVICEAKKHNKTQCQMKNYT